MSNTNLKPIQIVDVIIHKNAYSEQIFIVVDRMPEWIYHRNGNVFIANDSGFCNFMKGTERNGDAFAGRKFTISLDEGSEWKCNGDMWNIDSVEGYECYQAGISTVEKLGKCYVFNGAKVLKDVIDRWLEANTPSRNYYKYDKRETVAYWVDLYRNHPKWLRKVSPKRARKLRKKGVILFRLDDWSRAWSPQLERKVEEIRSRAA